MTGPVPGARSGRQGGRLGLGFAARSGFGASAVRREGVGEVHQLLVERFKLRLDQYVASFLKDREVLEDGEVEQAPSGLAGLVVSPLVAIDQPQGFVESGHHVINLVLGGLGPVLDLCPLSSDAGLFGLQDVFGDGVAVVELDQLLLLGGQLTQPTGVALALAAGDLSFFLDVGAHGSPDLLALLSRQPVGGVDVLQSVLDQGQAHVAGAAGTARRHATEAGVVLVVEAQLAAVAAVALALAAPAAADLAGQVVVVFATAAAAGAVAVQHHLHTLERVLVDERLVAAGLLDAAVGDDAEVVVVSEQPMHGRDVQRL